MIGLPFFSKIRRTRLVGVLAVLALAAGCNDDARSTIFFGSENIVLDLITILIEGLFAGFVDESSAATVMLDAPRALMGMLA